MTPFGTLVVLAGLVTGELSGQSLAISRSSTDLKTPGMLVVTMSSPAGKAPVALQWDLWVPPVIATSPADVTIGPAAAASGKFLTCAAKPYDRARRHGLRCVCILAGGEAPITDGPIAVIQYRAVWDPRGAEVRVALENILGVTENIVPIPIANVEGIIDIH
jgi:hypothetical protein